MAKKGRKDKARKSQRDSESAPARPEASSPQPGAAAADQPERVPAAQSAAPSDAGEDTPRNRLWSNVFIALFLAYQLAMPLRYYLGGRGYDERFSWRMFSTLRMQ